MWYKQKFKNRFGIRADLYFQRIGFTFPTQLGSVGNPNVDELRLIDRFSMLSFDIDFNWNFLLGKSTKLYLLGGIRNNFFTKHTSDYYIYDLKYFFPNKAFDHYKKYILGYKTGLGIDIGNLNGELTFNNDITLALKSHEVIAKNFFFSFNIFIPLDQYFHR